MSTAPGVALTVRGVAEHVSGFHATASKSGLACASAAPALASIPSVLMMNAVRLIAVPMLCEVMMEPPCQDGCGCTGILKMCAGGRNEEIQHVAGLSLGAPMRLAGPRAARMRHGRHIAWWLAADGPRLASSSGALCDCGGSSVRGVVD